MEEPSASYRGTDRYSTANFREECDAAKCGGALEKAAREERSEGVLGDYPNSEE